MRPFPRCGNPRPDVDGNRVSVLTTSFHRLRLIDCAGRERRHGQEARKEDRFLPSKLKFPGVRRCLCIFPFARQNCMPETCGSLRTEREREREGV